MKRRMWIAAIGLMLIAGCSASAGEPAPTMPPLESETIPTAEPIERFLKEGSPAPNFTLKTLDGGAVSLADYAGRPVFINFWATWCGPCRTEMPEIVAAYQAHQSEGLAVLAVNATQLDIVDDVQAFAQQFKMPFPVLLDEDNAVNEAYLIIGLPTSVFVDAEGRVSGVNIGPLTSDVIEKYLADILPDG